MAAVKKNLTQRTYLNTISALLDYVTTAVVAFVVNPLLLTYFESGLFGTWKICQRLLSFVSTADRQATQALKWTIAHKQDSDDYAAKRRNVGCAVFIWFCFFPFLVAIGATVAWFSPHFINNLPAESFLIVRLTCAVLVLNMIILPLQNIPEAILIGTNQAHKCMGIYPVAGVISGGLMVWAAYIGWGLVGAAGALLCGTIIRGVMILWVARRNVKWLGVNRPIEGEVRDFFGFSFWILCWTLVNKLMLTGDILILGLVISAEKVTSYVFSQYSMQMSISLVALLVAAAAPGLGGVVGKKDFVRAGKIRSEIMTFSWLIFAVLGTMMLLWNGSFVGLWAGREDIFVGPIENLMMVLLTAQLIFIRNDAFIIDVTLNIKKKVLLGAFSITLGLVLAYFLAQYFTSSVVGLVLGLMAGRSILMISYPLMVNKVFRLNYGEQLAAIIRSLVTIAILFSGATYLGMFIRIDNWLSLILYSGLSSILITVLVFYVGLSTQQRERVLIRFKNVRFFSF